MCASCCAKGTEQKSAQRSTLSGTTTHFEVTCLQYDSKVVYRQTVCKNSPAPHGKDVAGSLLANAINQTTSILKYLLLHFSLKLGRGLLPTVLKRETSM